jgi:acyl-CoA thioesterase FadM
LQDRSRDHGLTNSDRVPKQPGTILAHAECDFRSEAKYGDVLDVLVKVSAVGRSSFSYEYEVVEKSTNRLIATAKSVQVSYDAVVKRPVPIPDALRVVLEETLR